MEKASGLKNSVCHKRRKNTSLEVTCENKISIVEYLFICLFVYLFIFSKAIRTFCEKSPGPHINPNIEGCQKVYKILYFCHGWYVPVWRDHLAQKAYNTKMKITIVLLHQCKSVSMDNDI